MDPGTNESVMRGSVEQAPSVSDEKNALLRAAQAWQRQGLGFKVV